MSAVSLPVNKPYLFLSCVSVSPLDVAALRQEPVQHLQPGGGSEVSEAHSEAEDPEGGARSRGEGPEERGRRREEPRLYPREAPPPGGRAASRALFLEEGGGV